MVRPTSSGDQSDMATEEDLARHFKSPSPPPCSPPPSISMVPYYQGSGQSPMDKLLQNRQQSVSMAAPTNSEESEMATEEYLIYWNSPSPSSNSMVVYYQASGQSPMDNPLQNRQQQRNSGEWESDEAIEESEGMTGPGFYFPPSPTDFPPLPTTFPPSSPSFPPSLSPPRRSLSNSRAVSVSNTISITIATQNQQHKDIIGAYLNENPTDLFVGAFNVGKGGPFDLKKPRNSLSAAARHREKVSERIRFLKELVPGATKTDRAGNLDMAINYVQSLQRQVEFLSMKLETFNLMNALNAGLSTQTRADWGYGIHKWPPHNEHKFDGQSHPNGTPVVVDREEIPQLNSDTLRSLQALVATPEMNNVLMKELMSRSCHNKTPAAVDQEGTNNVHVNEITMPQFSPTVRQENLGEDFGNDIVEIVGIRGEGTREGEMEEGQLNYGCLNEGIRNVKIPAEDRGNKKATGVRIAISLEDILQTKAMSLKDAANHLNVSRSRWPPHDEHKLMRQSLPDEIPAIVDQEGILQLIENHVPSNQPMTATIDTNSVFKEIPPPQFLPTARQENRDENFATDEIEVIGMGGVGTGEGEMEVGQLNSRCSSKGKRIENTSRGGRGNNKTTGVRIAIPLEDILQTKEMRLKDAAKHLNVSRSTLKRACREYNIYRWPPREELKLLSQYSLPNKFPTVVDQEQIPQLNDATLLPSNQVPTTVNTNSTVTVKARIGKETIKFRLSWPWGTVELKQQVKKRLELEDGAYYIRYKDEDGELILIACDDDLKDCISSSSPLGSKSIEILLEPK